MSKSAESKVLIYNRISDPHQTGLKSQEVRCREWAESQGLDVCDVFSDMISGKTHYRERPALQRLIKHIKKNKNTHYYVVFDDQKRLARKTQVYLDLREILEDLGATAVCLNFHFTDTPEGRFSETVSAASGELERLQNARQARQKTIARLEAGLWAMKSPIGYKMEKQKGMGNIMVRDEPLASIIQEGIEGFASGRFQNVTELNRFFNTFPDYPRGADGKVHVQRTINLLKNNLYAGIVESKSYGVSAREGQHDGIISMKIFRRVQERLTQNAKVPAKKNLQLDFPLRGAVNCGDCGSALTSGWTKGRTAYYPYYLCCQKGCPSYGKSIRRDVIEGEFSALLRDMRPAPALIEVATRMLKDGWDHIGKTQKQAMQSMKQQLQDLESM